MSPPAIAQAISGRSTRAFVDLDAIVGNLCVFRAGISPATRIMTVVKANGYGHGATMVARTVLEGGADELAVATVDEGVRLRTAGIRAPILVLGPIHTSEIRAALDGDLMLSVADVSFIDALAGEVAQRSTAPAKIHLKIDTGMHRYGAPLNEATTAATQIAANPSLQLMGIFSHLACADETDETPSWRQLAAFNGALRDIQAAGVNPGCRHIANSAATLRSRVYDFDMVRIGISLYGIAPSSEIGLWPGMNQALTIHSRIHRLIDLEPGDHVSYGGTYQANQSEMAALIPIGYADGYHRSLSNRAWVDIASTRAPVRGRVCMDQTVVGLAAGVNVNLGHDVVVVGDGSNAAPTLAELAELAQTIPYEIATSVAARVPRHYCKGGRIVAVEDLSGLHTVDGEDESPLSLERQKGRG